MSVSIIIPNYNYSRYLSKRIDSILEQTYKNFELIILDDASTDDSINVIKRNLNKLIKYSLLINDINSGNPFVQWNKGIEKSKGKYIWVAESDDFAAADFLKKSVEILDNNLDVGIVFSNSYLTDANGQLLEKLPYNNKAFDTNIFNSDFICDGKHFIKNYLIHENVIPNASGAVFRKELYYKVDGVNIDIRTCSDWFLWLKILCFSNVAFISKPMNFFRRHDNSVIAKLKINSLFYNEKYSMNMRKLYNSWLRKNKLNFKETVFINNSYISYDYGNKGLFLLKNKFFFKGWKYIFKATFWPKFKLGYFKKAVRGRFV